MQAGSNVSAEGYLERRITVPFPQAGGEPLERISR